jgi:predicted nucleotide-binding protein (sugar kinase/HSP70/actin superfamily)
MSHPKKKSFMKEAKIIKMIPIFNSFFTNLCLFVTQKLSKKQYMRKGCWALQKEKVTCLYSYLSNTHNEHRTEK